MTTLGEAYDEGWKLKVRCERRHAGLKTVRPCVLMNKELDLETMIWTHGRLCPIRYLEGRVRCPKCGTLEVLLLWVVPANDGRARARS